MTPSSPRVTVGMPVYNGENFVAEAFESILAQTYPDLELIISDNASTDRTEEICRAYAGRDRRIRYVRNASNLGAARNFNQLAEFAGGEYFKWAAHDDLIAPTFLERCVEVLDSDPSVVLCHARTKAIDDHGAVVREFEPKDFGAPQPHKRFYECVCKPHPQTAVFGLIRMSALKRTQMIGSFSSSDRALLGELILLGRFHEIPEYLFFKRHHSEQHWQVYRSLRAREVWYDPNRAGKLTFRTWRLLAEHLSAIWKAPVTWRERLLCTGCMGWWVRRHWRHLLRELIPARV